MEQQQRPRLTLNFRLFGIPVAIMPISWIMLAIIGGGLGVSDAAGLSRVLLFTAAGMLTLLVHEFGHALVGRRVGAGSPSIVIAGLGGMTYTPSAPRTRAGYLAMVAAGPLASLLLGALTGLCLGLQIGQPLAGVYAAFLLPLPAIPLPAELAHALSLGLTAHPLNSTLLLFYQVMMGICFWWSFFNLLPIFPLDGGRLLATLLNSAKSACMVGLVVSGLLVLWSLISFNWFNILITGYLAYINFVCLRDIYRGERGEPS